MPAHVSRIRPAADFHGLISDVVSVKSWAGGQFSATITTASVEVWSVNDSPDWC